MDMPIYLRFADYSVRRSGPWSGPADRWYVIEEGGDQERAPDDELGDEHWIQKSVHDRVRRLHLPQMDYDLRNSYFAVSKSRLFFVGGYSYRKNESGRGSNAGNGILHIDLQQQSHPSWERCDKWDEELSFLCAAAVFDEGDSIYAATIFKFLRRFSCRNVEGGDIISLAPPPAYAENFRPQVSLAVTASKMLLYQPPPFNGQGPALLGYYNLDYNRWEKIISLPATICARSWGFKPLAFYRTVLVRDSFLIYFACFGIPPMVANCGPALYVFDIGGGKWLSKPVQGLPNDDITLPHMETELPVVHASLMQVRRDVLKFALVWSMRGEDDDDGCVSDQTEVHWTKFILRIEENDNDPPTFHADCKSSGIIYGGYTALVNCRAG